MIIFYNKITGKIIGAIEGRAHTNEHLKMWIGSSDENARIICNWKPIGGSEIKNETGQIVARDFEPDVPEPEQKESWEEIDQNPQKLYSYKVDDGKLIKLPI